ncbi:hypothetical protein BDW67DRAFT_164783 [Aspergillus spinulosporus]
MTSIPVKRKRARVACEPCRSRKRKCDGAAPCQTCMDWGYECYYAAAPNSRHNTGVSPSEAPPEVSGRGGDSHRLAIDPQRVARSLTANSSAVFVRKMGLKVDPVNAPRVNLFAWNVGARRLSSGLVPAPAGLPLVDLVPLGSMRQLAEVYFAKVDPCYGFIDQQNFLQRLDARWSSSGSGHSDIYDSVLAGVAALGVLFSERSASATELQLIETAKSILDSYDGHAPPSLDLITGWVLRVVYMRMTAAPYSTWLASSTVVHLIEAAGLQHEDPSPAYDPDIRRRLVGVALHQNMWPSYDIGLSRVQVKAELLLFTDIQSKPGDYTAELLGLLPISARLDPETCGDGDSDVHLHQSLVETLDRTHTQPPSILAQTNLVLCILRRLNLLNISTSPALPDRILALFQRALQSARSMLTACCPWQHIANVPFHIIAILLEMDTRASLALLPEAVQTVKLVASVYNTPTMREAYTTARFLVFVYQQRRSRDVRLLTSVLDADGHPEVELEPGSTAGDGIQPARPRPSPNLDEMPLLEGLVADMSELQELDFDQFLSLDTLRSA